MIYTVTFNPSLDYIVGVENFALGKTNRTSSEQIFPGGKGINVSIVLRNLGFASTALGFVGGFVGEEIEKRLKDFGIKTMFIPIEDGVSRINVKLSSVDGTEINGAGPEIPTGKVDELLARLETLAEGDVLFLAGSVPASMPSDIYREIMKRLSGKGIKIIVDASKNLLLKVLEYKPFLIKPNKQELEELFDVTLETNEEVIAYAGKLQQMGAENVLVSLGKDGAVLLAQNGEIHQAKAPAGTVINSVGAGDSMVAGFMAAYLSKQDYRYAFYRGLAAGSASAFSKDLCTAAEVERVYGTMEQGL